MSTYSNPHFSHLVYCIGAMLRRAAPTARPASAATPDPQAGALARGAAHSDQSFHRFATTWCEKSGLRIL